LNNEIRLHKIESIKSLGLRSFISQSVRIFRICVFQGQGSNFEFLGTTKNFQHDHQDFDLSCLNLIYSRGKFNTRNLISLNFVSHQNFQQNDYYLYLNWAASKLDQNSGFWCRANQFLKLGISSDPKNMRYINSTFLQ
jgi:hypothetical protein